MSKMLSWGESINWLPISAPMLRPVLKTLQIYRLRQFKNCTAPVIRFVPLYYKRLKAVIAISRRPAPLSYWSLAAVRGPVFLPKPCRKLGSIVEQKKAPLRVVHQVRQPEMREALDAYAAEGVYSEIRDFFDDLPVRMRRAHLMIARSGASTVAEATALGCAQHICAASRLARPRPSA